MTCAKAVVRASLHCKDGKVYHGENRCEIPQTKCPRWPGEGYLKCISICRQPFHAEVDAIFAAENGNSEPRGGHMVIYYRHICDQCRSLLEKYDITWELR